MSAAPNRAIESLFLGLLALLWGSSYLFIKVAVSEITPITLIALRVSGAALFLWLVLVWRRRRLPRDPRTWRRLGIQAVLNSIAAWTLLAWGQQHVDAGLASVLNSTSPIFVYLFTAVAIQQQSPGRRKLLGAVLGLSGVVLIVGVDVLAGLGTAVAGQLACLVSAMLYAGAAMHGRRFTGLGALETALGTLIWASAVLVPAAFVFEAPLDLTPSPQAVAATAVLSVLCTGVALLIYFRLVQTLGSMGAASQAYLRVGIAVLLGIVVLGERLTLPATAGILFAVVGVVLINIPVRETPKATGDTR